MDRSEASESTYPESTAGPASPIFGTASFSTFTTTALTSLWPGSSRRNQSSSYCASDGNSVVEDHHRDAIAGVVDNRSDSSLTYNPHTGHSRSTSSVTERERNTLSSSSLTASYHVRSSTDPYTSPSTPAPSARTQSFTPSTLTPSTFTPSTPSHSRATNSYSDSTPTRHSASISYPTTLSSSQLHTPSTSQPSTSTRDLIAMYEQRAGRSSPLPFSSSTGTYTRSGPIARPDSPLKSPSTTTQSASVPPLPGYLPRSLRGTTVDSRSSGARSEVSGWSFGSSSESQTHTRSQSQTETRSGRAPSRPSSPSKSGVSGWSYSTSSGGGGGGIIGAITGFVGLSGGRSAYSSSGRTSSPSRSYTRRSRSTSRSGRSPFSTTRRRTSTSPSGRGKERARSTGRRSPSRTTRIESETTTEDLGVVEPEEQAELVYEAPLWYYNVHRLSDYTWQRGHAQLYPHMLVVRWSEASGLIAEVKLDLLSCVEIRTVRPSGTERDIRVEVEREDGRRESMRLMTFELGYSDSLERLGGETRSDMVAWFEAIQTVFNGNMSITSSSAAREPSPARSESESAVSSPEAPDSDSLIQVGSKSTIFISSSPRRRPISPPAREEAAPLREEVVRRSTTPPVHTTVNNWWERTRAARSEVSTLFDDSRSHTTETATVTNSGSGTRTTENTFTSLSGGRTMLEVGSSTGTDIVASTLSLRNTADASLLGDSEHGVSSFPSSFSPSLHGRAEPARALYSALRQQDTGQTVHGVVQHPTGSTRSGQSLSYVSQPPDPGDVSQDDSDYLTAGSPSASFVSLDPMEVLPGEDPDEVFGFRTQDIYDQETGDGAFWDGDQLLTPTAEEPEPAEPESEAQDVEIEESVQDDQVTLRGVEETEVGTEEPVPVPPPVEPVEPPTEPEVQTPTAEKEPSLVAEDAAPEPEPSVVAEEPEPEPVDEGPKPEEIPLPPSVYSPSVASQVLPAQTESSDEPPSVPDPTERTDSDSLSSLSGPELAQLPADMLPPEPTTPEILDAVASQLDDDADVESEVLSAPDESELEAEAELQPESEPELQPESEPQVQSEPEPEPEPEPETEPEHAPSDVAEPAPPPMSPSTATSWVAENAQLPKSPSVATSWGAETDGTYDSSVLQASPSVGSEVRRLQPDDAIEAESSVAPLESASDTSLVATEEELTEDDAARTPVARAMSLVETESEWSSEWSESTGPPSVPSNTLNTLSEREENDGVGVSVEGGSLFNMSPSEVGSVEPKVYAEAAVSPHMEVAAITETPEMHTVAVSAEPEVPETHTVAVSAEPEVPETHAVAVSAEPEVGHKGVDAVTSRIDLMDLEPRFDKLTSNFKTMLTEETGKLLQYFDERGNSTGKDLQDMLDLLRRTDENLAKHLDRTPEFSVAQRTDFATSPIMVARMECSTSPIPFIGIDRGLSPIDIKLYRDAEIMSSPVQKQADVHVTLLSPPRKRAVTPESVVGSYLSSHYSDEVSDAQHEGDISVERVWPESGSPLSESSFLSAVSNSSRRTVQYAIEHPQPAASRISSRRRVSSPPATIPGFNIPLNDDVSPLDSVSHVGVNAPRQPTIIDVADQHSILLEPVTRAGSIQMPIPLRAVPFEGSLADLLVNQPPSEHPDVTSEPLPSVTLKVDQGTSPLVAGKTVVVGLPAQSIAPSEAERAPETPVIEKVEMGVSPMMVPVTPKAESELAAALEIIEPEAPIEPEVAESEAAVEPEPVGPLTMEKGVSPIMPMTEPVMDDPEDDIPSSTTEKAVSPMTIVTAVPPEPEEEEAYELADDAGSVTEKAVSPTTVIAAVPELEPSVVDIMTAEAGVSPIVFPMPVPEPLEERVEVADKNVSPATTINALPATVEVSCGTEPEPTEFEITEATAEREADSSDIPSALESPEEVVASDEPFVEDAPVEAPAAPETPAPALIHEPDSPPDSPAPATPRLTPSPEYLVILDELRKSREESTEFKQRWAMAQEDADRRRDESLAIQRDLHDKVDRMMNMFESLSKHGSPLQTPGIVPGMYSLSPGFVAQKNEPMQFMYPPPPLSVYAAAVPYITPAQVPIPPTPAEAAVIPPMPTRSAVSSRSSTPSTLRTTRDYPLPSLDMPNMTASFPMPQPQFFAPMDAPGTPLPMFMQPTVQMGETPVPTVLPMIPPTPSDTTSSPAFTTRSVNLDKFPLPADFAKTPGPVTAQATPAALATPYLQTPEPVIPPQPVPEESTQPDLESVEEAVPADDTVPAPVAIAEPAASTPVLTEDPVAPVVQEAVEVPATPVVPEAAVNTPSPAMQIHAMPSPSVTVHDQPRSVSPVDIEPAVALESTMPSPPVPATPIPVMAPSPSPATLSPVIPVPAVGAPSPSHGSPRFVGLPPSPSRSNSGDSSAITQSMWEAANDLRLAVQTTLNAAQGAEAYSRQAQEILGIVCEHGQECAKQLEECSRLREAAQSDKDAAHAEREQAQSDKDAAHAEREQAQILRDEAALERERGMAERDARIEELESELSALNSQIDEQKESQQALDAEREATRAAVDAEREARIQALEDELENIKAEQEREKEALLAEAAERQAALQALADANTESESRIVALEEEKTQNESRIVAFEEEKTEDESRIVALEEEKTHNEGRIAELEEVKTQNEGRIAELEEEKTNNEGRIAELEEEKAEIGNRIAALEEEKLTTVAEYEKVMEDHTALQEAKAEIESRIAILEEEKATLVTELEAEKEKHHDDLSEKVAEAETARADFDAQIAELEEEKIAISAELDAVKEQHDAALLEKDAERERALEDSRAEHEQRVADLDARIQEAEEHLTALRSQHEEELQRRDTEESERVQASVDREKELADSVTDAEERVHVLETELADARAALDHEKDERLASEAALEASHLEVVQAKDAEAEAKEQELLERIMALDEELAAARAAYMAEHERLVNEYTSHEAAWQEREDALAEAEAALQLRLTALEDELATSRQQYEEVQQSLADATATHEENVGNLEADLAAARERHAELEASLADAAATHGEQIAALEVSLADAAAAHEERIAALEESLSDAAAAHEERLAALEASMADAAAAHEEQVAALEADLTSTRDQHENAQLSIAEYSEKEVAWTEREGALISDAEERDARIKALEDDVAALREEQEQDRQRRLAEDNERTERDLVATAASLERERALAESHDARIKELTEELAALRAEREVDKQQRETEDAVRREADKAEAKQVAEAHTTQLTGIEEQLAKIVEHSDEQFVQYEARVQEVVVRLDKIEDGAVKDRELHEAEMAEAAAKPTMESILEANKTDLQATILAQLESIESNLRTDGDEKHEDILAKLKTMVEEQASMAITGCIADFSAMLESLGTTQQAEILSALRIAIQEQVTLNISFYIEELSKTWDAHGARLLAEVLDTVRATARDVVEYNTENHLTDFCKNLAPEMLQLFHEIREKEEEKQKLDRQIDVLRRHKRDYESGDLQEQEDVPEEVPMKGAWRGRSEGRHRDHEPVSVPLPPQPEPLYAQVPPPPLSRRAPSFQEPDAGRPMSTWSSWHHGTMSHSSTDPSVQLALIAPPAEGGEYGGQSPYYRE